MLRNYFKIKIAGKDVKRFVKSLIRQNVYFEEIYFDDDVCYAKVDNKSYLKLKDIRTSYDIKLIKLYGLNNIIRNIKANSIILFATFIGILVLYFLSNIIFDVEIIHSDKKIRDLLSYELKKHDIKKYSLVKNYDRQSKIKKEILAANKELIEWLEIERVGTKYVIRVERRIINNIEKEDKPKHIVAAKSGIIMKIDASNGEIQKKVNDYVKAGDILISGAIHKNEAVVDNISAKGKVYAEVWYKAKIELPINYKEEKKTGKKKTVLNFSFLNNEFNLFDFDKYNTSIVQKKPIFKDFFGLFSINIAKYEETIVKDEINTFNADNIAFNLAEEKIKINLSKGDYIISRKKLKTTIKDSTINIEIFFKVCEDISKVLYYNPTTAEE